jgi:hypothetical protein
VQLELVWDDEAELGRAGLRGAPMFIVNKGSAVWTDEAGEYWAFVSVFDAQTGDRMPSQGVAIAGVGRSYRVLPGDRVAIGAAVTCDVDALPPGRYELEATVPELGLRSRRRTVELD